MLGQRQDPTNRNYAAAFLDQDVEGKEDAFYQFVLAAVYDKEPLHSEEADGRASNRKMQRCGVRLEFYGVHGLVLALSIRFGTRKAYCSEWRDILGCCWYLPSLLCLFTVSTCGCRPWESSA